MNPASLIRHLKRMQAEQVDLTDFADLIANADMPDPWKAAAPTFAWRLYRGVPIKLLDPQTREDYETDFTLDEDEIEQNLDRYDVIAERINAGEEPWPVLVDERGLMLDGYHRLAVLNDFGERTVDVLMVQH